MEKPTGRSQVVLEKVPQRILAATAFRALRVASGLQTAQSRPGLPDALRCAFSGFLANVRGGIAFRGGGFGPTAAFLHREDHLRTETAPADSITLSLRSIELLGERFPRHSVRRTLEIRTKKKMYLRDSPYCRAFCSLAAWHRTNDVSARRTPYSVAAGSRQRRTSRLTSCAQVRSTGLKRAHATAASSR